MGTSLEDLRVLQIAEEIVDGIWRQVVEWESFAREVVGGQMAPDYPNQFLISNTNLQLLISNDLFSRRQELYETSTL